MGGEGGGEGEGVYMCRMGVQWEGREGGRGRGCTCVGWVCSERGGRGVYMCRMGVQWEGGEGRGVYV